MMEDVLRDRIRNLIREIDAIDTALYTEDSVNFNEDHSARMLLAKRALEEVLESARADEEAEVEAQVVQATERLRRGLDVS